MANPQPTDAHLRIAHSIQEEIMMRDFTKRQRSIVDLILRLSWGCNKKTAIIPRQRDFEMVGIGEGKIKRELQWLVNAKVIIWSRDTNEFSFNKNYDQWLVSIVPGYDKELFSQLLHLNLYAYQNGKQLTKPGSTETYQDGKFLTKKESLNLPKREDEHVSNAELPTADDRSKESIKENIYNVHFEHAWKTYPVKRGKGKISEKQKKLLENEVGLEQLLRCIKRYKQSKPDWQQYQNGDTFFRSGYADFLDDVWEEKQDIEHGNIIL